MKYIFKQIDDISGNEAETTIEFKTDYLPTVLEHFEMFLRGSGFHPSGTLEFVDESLQFEPAEEHYEEAVKEEWPFPLPKQPVMQEPIYDDDCESPSAGATGGWINPWPSVAITPIQWTAEQLIRPPQMKDVCAVCKIDNETMLNHECWDKNCPKGQDAN
jgi:hypothetical protein